VASVIVDSVQLHPKKQKTRHRLINY
jgi:hypothetical protein